VVDSADCGGRQKEFNQPFISLFFYIFPEIPEEMISVYTLNRNLIDETFEMEVAYGSSDGDAEHVRAIEYNAGKAMRNKYIGLKRKTTSSLGKFKKLAKNAGHSWIELLDKLDKATKRM
jgi:hypothetical protein